MYYGKANTDPENAFELTVGYQTISAFLMGIISLLYCFERKNDFAQYYYARLERINAKKVEKSICADFWSVC